ncbi:MAG TPA: TFIIB-type zinc ribbon-containing protein [Nitrososphaera sp.]|nr:TFIIB-type zinc ribbon-containing protein [Nitrososphaera sp.]
MVQRNIYDSVGESQLLTLVVCGGERKNMETGVAVLTNGTKNDDDVRPSCPECSSHLIFDIYHGEYICQSCGYVVLEKIDYCGHEMHSNNSEDRLKNLRGSGQTSSLLMNYGLQTEISISDKDYNGKPINLANAERIACVRKLHARLKASSEERRIARVLSVIDKICSKLLLPRSLSETAAKIYRSYSSKNNTKGMSVNGNAIAAVYLACKQSCIARGLEEIVDSTDFCSNKRSSLRIAFRCYKRMAMCMTNAIESDNMRCHRGTTTFDHVIPLEKYIAKISNRARIDWRIQKLALEIARQTEDNILLSGKDPVGIASAYLYISACLCGYHMYLTDIANFSQVTEITIRTRCKEILSSFNLEVRVRTASFSGSVAC